MSSAMRTWTRESTYTSNSKTLLGDVQHSAIALRTTSESVNNLHTVCGVLLYESEEANASLPTPDHLVNTLLSKAYGNLGAGANICYKSGHDLAQRAKALNYLSTGVGQLAEASARIRSDLTP